MAVVATVQPPITLSYWTLINWHPVSFFSFFLFLRQKAKSQRQTLKPKRENAPTSRGGLAPCFQQPAMPMLGSNQLVFTMPVFRNICMPSWNPCWFLKWTLKNLWLSLCNSLRVQRLPSTAGSWGLTTIYVILRMITRCAPQWTGRTDRLLQMNRVKSKTSGKLPITWKASTEIIPQIKEKTIFMYLALAFSLSVSNKTETTERSQHVTCWTRKGCAQKSPRTLVHYIQWRDVCRNKISFYLHKLYFNDWLIKL